MANQKQDGSNLVNLEYGTGRCYTHCEQCFVNYGQQGFVTAPSKLTSDQRASFLWMLDRAKRDARYMVKPYNVPDLVPEDEVPPAKMELLSAHLKPSGVGLYNIPTKSGDQGRKKEIDLYGHRVKNVLRVSSMSDSSYSPYTWLRNVYKSWKDQCFFNSAIGALGVLTKQEKGSQREKIAKKVLDTYHKLVITTNHGHQKLPPYANTRYRPIGTKVKKISKKTGKESEKTDRAPWARIDDAKQYVPGSMGQIAERPGDFLHPITIRDVGLKSLLGTIKWYRRRSIATVVGRFQKEPDAQVVETQMRFKEPTALLEFCRRYGLNFDVLYGGSSCPKSIATAIQAFGFNVSDFAKPKKGGGKSTIRVWATKGDDRNERDAEVGGEATEFYWTKSFWRQSGDFSWAPWVCDRLHNSCKSCGLCATLDSTEKGGVLPGAHLIPQPYTGGYMFEAWPQSNPGEEGDFFDFVMGAMIESGGGRNPRSPAEVEAAMGGLEAVAAYLDKGATNDLQFCEGWNTHEDAEEVEAYAIWSLLCHAARTGKGIEWVLAMVDEATGGLDVWSDEEMENLLDGSSMWYEVFGPLR